MKIGNGRRGRNVGACLQLLACSAALLVAVTSPSFGGDKVELVDFQDGPAAFLDCSVWAVIGADLAAGCKRARSAGKRASATVHQVAHRPDAPTRDDVELNDERKLIKHISSEADNIMGNAHVHLTKLGMSADVAETCPEGQIVRDGICTFAGTNSEGADGHEDGANADGTLTDEQKRKAEQKQMGKDFEGIFGHGGRATRGQPGKERNPLGERAKGRHPFAGPRGWHAEGPTAYPDQAIPIRRDLGYNRMAPLGTGDFYHKTFHTDMDGRFHEGYNSQAPYLMSWGKGDHSAGGHYVGERPYEGGYLGHSYGGGFSGLNRERQLQLRYGRFWQHMAPHQRFGSPYGDILMPKRVYGHQINPRHPSRKHEMARKKKFKKIAMKKKFKNFDYDGERCQA